MKSRFLFIAKSRDSGWKLFFFSPHQNNNKRTTNTSPLGKEKVASQDTKLHEGWVAIGSILIGLLGEWDLDIN